jgi:transposase
MATRDCTFVQWLTQADVSADRLAVEQTAVLQAAFRFRERVGTDYYSTRVLSHVLLHCGSGLAVAQIARLLSISRPTASRQQGLSSKEVVQAAHHRMAGRAHGKLLPRYAGPIAEFMLSHADATRLDILDFIQRTWGVSVSAVALYHFCKKFGLDRATRAEALTPPPPAEHPPAEPRPAEALTPPPSAERPPAEPRPVETVPPSQPVPLPPPPFCRRGPSTQGRSS